MSNVKENFLRYVQIETTSSETSGTCPSTPNQWVLAKMLVDELHAMGIENARVDDHCYVYATIPAKGNHPAKVGLISHMDTSDGVKGPTHPVIIEHYDGRAITLKNGVVIDGFDFLESLKGQDLIVTDGESVLGADDKAGVAEIMTAAEYMLSHPEIRHGKIRIGFTPDEEIGRGVDFFDVKAFGADFAYTMDGGFEGELEYENFNAASAKIEIQGRNVHPGYAKDKMINAIQVACELNALLPAWERPEHTEGYDGFYHCIALNGTVDQAQISYIVRDHDSARFEARKNYMQECVDLLARKYGEGVLTLTLKDSYYNMRKMVEPHPQVIDKAIEAMKMAGVEPLVKPIRGGTDGARLSFMGLPCPNIFTGGMNFHGRYEYCSLTTMHKAMQVILNLAQLWTK